MLRSSTSSSEGFPWAGLATVCLVLVLDLLCFGRAWPWLALGRRFPTQHLLAAGIEADHAALEDLRAAPRDRLRVALLGSSRLQATLAEAELAPVGDARGPGVVAVFAHAGLEPFAMRALAERLAALRVDVALLHLSEFDSHRPPDARPATSVGGLAAVADLAAALGPAEAWRARTWLEQLALASVFAAYRHREVLQAHGLGSLRAFTRGVGARPPPRAPGLAGGDLRPELDVRRRQQLAAELPGLAPNALEAEMNRIRSISRGPHVDVQERLIAAAVERLRRSGARVILLEAPLSPASAELYDVSTRGDFEALARGLAARPGVAFAPLAERFFEEDFRDFSHLAPRGGERMTPAIDAALRAAAAEGR